MHIQAHVRTRTAPVHAHMHTPTHTCTHTHKQRPACALMHTGIRACTFVDTCIDCCMPSHAWMQACYRVQACKLVLARISKLNHGACILACSCLCPSAGHTEQSESTIFVAYSRVSPQALSNITHCWERCACLPNLSCAHCCILYLFQCQHQLKL